MLKCPQCGFENAGHSRFCSGCGVALQSTAPGLGLSLSERTLPDQEPPRPRASAGLDVTILDSDSGGAGPKVLSLVGNKEQYEVIDELGRGGMSVVYRARDRKLHREVALKRLLPKFTQRERAVARLMVEARSIANLQHPHIVNVFDIDQDQDGPYIAMELVAGQDGRPLTLAQKVQRDGLMNAVEAVDLAAKLCQAVAHAHQKGIVHRDIKPANILMTAEGAPKLLDFGVAQAAGETIGESLAGLTQDSATLGTLDYMAPEQENDAGSVDGRADIYSLGGVLYFCMTGLGARHFRESNVPSGLRGVLSKALEHNPAKRYARAEDFAAALQTVRSSLGANAAETPLPQPAEEEPAAEPLMGAEECTRVGLPPIPDDIVALHVKVGELERSIRQMENGTHPMMREVREQFLQKEAQWEALQKELALNVPQVPEEVRQRIEQAVAQDRSGSDMRLCAQFSEVPGTVLMAYLGRLRRAGWLSAERELARSRFDEAVAREVPPAKQEWSALESRLVARQREDFQEVLKTFFGRLQPAWEFPLQEWARIEGALTRRRYRWEMAETFRNAERFFDDWCCQRAEKEGATASWEEHLGSLPPGGRAEQARLAVQQLKDRAAWTQAIKEDRPESYQPYLAAFPEGQHAADARRMPARFAWEAARDKNTGEALQDYLRAWPVGPHAQEARKLLEVVSDDKAWAEAMSGGKREWFEAYLSDRPQGRHSAEARAGLDRCHARRRKILLCVGALLVLVAVGLAVLAWDAASRAQLAAIRKLAGNKDFPLARVELDVIKVPPWRASQVRTVRDEVERAAAAEKENLARLETEHQRQAEAQTQRRAREEADRRAREEARQAAQRALDHATKEKPFVNSLGMRFVPVPGTEVLFSIWETRLADYAAYASSNRGVAREWQNPTEDMVPVTPSKDCPVVNVNWDEANAFCAWLTKKEWQEGKLGARSQYRLPTDVEWSFAVGLPSEPGRTPMERNIKIQDQYPWGSQWPPPPGMGNFADESVRRKFPSWTVIMGYDDGFVTTSPVGRFASNQYGIYDLAGNAWEWCDDWYDGSERHRVMRGGSWGSGSRGELVSSRRNHDAPQSRHGDVGFRVVLGASSAR